MKPLAQDTPLHVEKLWLAGLRDRGPLWRLRRLIDMTGFCWQAAYDACRRAQPEATPLAREAWLLQERYGHDLAHRVLEWYRAGSGVSNRQWYDLQGVLRLQVQSLDLAYLQQWASELGIATLLHRAMEEAGLSGI